ncbi:MAG: type IV pilus secretin PilQ [Pelobacteraceae bacterium]
MKWKKHIVKIAFISFSIITSLLAASPDVGICAEQLDAKKLVGIESVTSTGDGSATELTIKLTAPATYTSYKTISPLRLVIDLSQVTQGNILAPLHINKGNFKTVTASRFDTDAGVLTRLEIELVSDSEAVITTLPANPGELKVTFPALSVSSPSSKSDFSEKQNVAELPAALSNPSVTAIDSSNTTLTAISVNNNTITLALDGLIGDFKTFRLNKPERYVVDLINVKSGLTTKLLPLNASGVASARIGLYPDKVRVVLDSVNGSFPEATAIKTDRGIIVTLNTKSDAENINTKLISTRTDKPQEEQDVVNSKPVTPLDIQPETKAVVKPAGLQGAKSDSNSKEVFEKQLPNIIKKVHGTSAVEMIDFQVIDGISRLSVKVNGDIHADQPVKTPGYVTLTLKNSVLPKKLQRSLETRSFASPVLRVTPLSIKTKKGTDTKIRIAMRVASSFEYRQEGDMIYIDFKHPEGLSGDKLIIEATSPKNISPLVKPEPSREDVDLSSVSETTSKPVGASHVYKGRKVTLEFADADVRKIFQLLSEVSNKNFVLSDDVTGNISMKLVNVPWDQALDIILDTKGLDKREDGNIILIKGKGKFGTQEAADAENKKNIEKNLALQPAKVFSVNYATLADIVTQIEKLSSGPKGSGTRTDSSVISDSRTNKIIVVDTLNRIVQMQALLSEIDQPEKQVMIEARIVEASSTFSRNLGVSWGVHQRDGSASFLGINSLDTAFGGLTSAPPIAGVATAAGGSMGISFGTLASNIQLDTRLNAAATAGLVKIVSTPKVATLNNKTAKITQGQSIPYTASTSDKVETKFIEAALSLEVTPHINANGTISMKIDAKNDSPGAGGNPPPINKKQATTEMLLRDGETTVIGGIYVDSDQESDEGVPYLMDIPFLGNLFKSNTKSKTKTELLIFITPRILGAV